MVTELSERLDSELREVRVTHQQLKEQNDDLRHKMSFFIRVSNFSVSIVYHCIPVGEHCRLE